MGIVKAAKAAIAVVSHVASHVTCWHCGKEFHKTNTTHTRNGYICTGCWNTFKACGH